MLIKKRYLVALATALSPGLAATPNGGSGEKAQLP